VLTILSLLPSHIEDRVDELIAFGVLTLGPLVSGAGLTEDEVVRPEDLGLGPRSDAVHGSGLQIHEDGAWDEPPATRLVVVDNDSLDLY